MRTLTCSTGYSDTKKVSFLLDVGQGKYPKPCVLHHGYHSTDDGIYWAMGLPTVILNHYSDADIEERDRLAFEGPVKDGEEVQIDGGVYTVLLIGDYSNAAIFVPLGEKWTHDRWSATVSKHD